MDQRQRLRDLAVSESGFVFDPYTGNTFSVNSTGAAIIEALRQELGREQIGEMLVERFQVGEVDVQRDIDDFVGLLRQEQILPAEFVL